MLKEVVVRLGLAQATVRLGEHIAYFWEDEREFEQGVDFLIEGLSENDCAVVFGHDEANKKVCEVIRRAGWDVDDLIATGCLSVLGPEPAADAMLRRIEETFQAALGRGTQLIRLLGDIGWAKPGWPAEADLLEFEAKVTRAARRFPCIVVCMYDVGSLPGTVILHGAFETHPFTVYGNVVRENRHYLDIDEFLARRRKSKPDA
jgi:hypothetical protein